MKPQALVTLICGPSSAKLTSLQHLLEPSAETCTFLSTVCEHSDFASRSKQDEASNSAT